ncbi:hypothetical protein [Nocardiopsis rhodophaea]|uniref:hypothetical protein n=1 Tax=Nocardiopsis rhodophaea TaxID=280238 RepID=UPI0031D16B76
MSDVHIVYPVDDLATVEQWAKDQGVEVHRGLYDRDGWTVHYARSGDWTLLTKVPPPAGAEVWGPVGPPV